MKTTLKSLFTFFLSILPLTSLQAQDCICEDAFRETVQVYEENYSLFIYKVTEANRDLYNAHKTILQNQAANTSKMDECKAILDQYLHFFRDGHTYILNSSKGEKEIYKEKIKISENRFINEFKNNNHHLNPILGIWKNGDYKVAIIQNPNNSNRKRDYVGVVLNSTNPNWEKSDVKFELISNFGTSYQINFMMGDHSIKKTNGQQKENTVLEIDGLSNWIKIWPEEKLEPKNVIESKYKEFHLSYIDDIPYLRLPDFYSVGGAYVDSLLQSNHKKIMNSGFMIVDVRGNSGGNDATYFPVLPYILSGPIQLPASGFWLSDYNIQRVMDYKTRDPLKRVEEYTQKEKEDYDLMISNKGTAYFDYPEYAFTYNADTLYSGPRKIVILTDKETASSGETFVYRANQSDKVVVYGQNTAGVVDGFNGLSKNIGCFEVVFPSSYRAKDIKENPIDPYGIAPDVYVNEKVDALKYAIEHMNQLIENLKEYTK